MSMSPCMRCTRVPDPRACENKECQVWRDWFIEKWNAMRVQPRLGMEKAVTEPEGVCIGGEFYALPHRVNSYLKKDPCDGCLCPRDMCRIPCKVKRVWLRAREDVFL